LLRQFRERVEPALGLLLPLSAFAALAAFLMGQLLALEGGFPAAALGWHRRLTLLAVIGMSGCWLLYARQGLGEGRGRLAYRGALVATLGVLSLGAHFGGTMTRGEGYLSKYAPGPLKPLLGAPEEPESPAKAAKTEARSEPLVFEDVVQPILKNYCFECHGTEKQKGKLRIDSLELLLAGGESGAVLVPGDPKQSPLLARMLLPIADDERMPPEGKPSPKPEELALIQFWIERGASPSLKVRDALAPVVSRSLLERSLGGALPTSVAPPPSPSAAVAAPPEPRVDEPAAAKATSRPSASPPLTEERTEPVAAARGAASGPAVLAIYCEKCHGPAKRKGKLRVDSIAALLQGGEGGAAVVFGKPDQSSLVQRVRLPLDNDEHMPPPKEPQPTAAEVSVLAAWIRSASAGAVEAARAPVAAAAGTATAGAAATSTAAATSAAAPPVVENVETAPPAPPEPTRSSSQTVSFAAVQLVFRDKCGKCHIREKPAGGLGVEQHAQLMEGGYTGAGIVPRDRKASLVMQRLLLPPSDDEHMPPPGEPALSAAEIELVGAWIDRGAPASGESETPAAAATAPEPLAAKSGGCAACSVPGARPSKWLALQAFAMLAVAALVTWRRRGRR
ncbi:MAG: hypothetical protein K0R38_4238, partial [Polyangiaceae bacterium]|nr:hypothetical protein [Polyangiaceae bacterium]